MASTPRLVLTSLADGVRYPLGMGGSRDRLDVGKNIHSEDPTTRRPALEAGATTTEPPTLLPYYLASHISTFFLHVFCTTLPFLKSPLQKQKKLNFKARKQKNKNINQLINYGTGERFYLFAELYWNVTSQLWKFQAILERSILTLETRQVSLDVNLKFHSACWYLYYRIR